MKSTNIMKTYLKETVLRPALCLLVATRLATFSVAAEVTQLTPGHRAERVLVPTDSFQERHYLAFPALLDTGDEVLVSFKRGSAHGGDGGAVIDSLRLDKASDRIVSFQVVAQLPGKIMQMGEWVRYPNGDIGSYIDAQQPTKPARIGMRGTRSTDGGRTFGPLETIGVIDGVEYGYPFQFVTEGPTTWALVMSFANLTGGYSVYPPRAEAGQVSIIRSEDSGRTWHFVRDLSREFGGIPINESSFVRFGDGFMVITRGYDNRARLHATDNDFKVRQQVDLTHTYSFIASYVGRPRVFVRDGRLYLIGRNWTEEPKSVTGPLGKDGVPTFPPAMKLCLFRLDPATLSVNSYSILDNAENGNVTDAYYPVPYFREKDGQTYLRVIDYKGMDEKTPQILEFEYLWNEVR